MVLFVLAIEIQYFNTIIHYVNIPLQQICLCYIVIKGSVIVLLLIQVEQTVCALFSTSLWRF